jgi:hypothetical protein
MHILDFPATVALRRASGILLVPASTVSLAAVGVPRGCGQMKGDDLCVLPTGIGLGEGRVAFVGKGVALERLARAGSWPSLWPSTIAKARLSVGVPGASCSLGLSGLWLSTIAKARLIVGVTGASCLLGLSGLWLSTIAKARFIVGVTGASCSFGLSGLFSWSDILLCLSSVEREEKEREDAVVVLVELEGKGRRSSVLGRCNVGCFIKKEGGGEEGGVYGGCQARRGGPC